MKYKVMEFSYGIYCVVLYQTFFGFPYWIRVITCYNQDELLDTLNKFKKSKVDQLMQEKLRLEKELEIIKQLIREKVYKTKY